MTVALVVGVLLTAACRGQDTGAAPDDATNPAVAGMTPTGTPTAGTPGTPPTREPGGQMDIRISGASLEMRGTLEDTVTARDFAALLPLTLTLNDFAGTEKVADLPVRLDTTAAPAWHTGRPGDITYYAPGETSPCSTALAPARQGSCASAGSRPEPPTSSPNTTVR